MLVVNSEELYKSNDILGYLPRRIRKYFYFIEWEELEEIRLRQGLPVMLEYRDGTFFVDDKGKAVLTAEGKLLTVTKEDITEAVELISHSSFYAHNDDIKNGYITISGGNRVGITGRGVTEEGELKNLKEISGLNYRIAHEVVACGDRLMDIIMDVNRVKNTIIISPPGCGKTTLLRDIARNISGLKKRVSIVDERSEITAVFNGFSGYNLGSCCDIMAGVPKDKGMLMMLRSMSPEVIVTDELGEDKEILAVEKIINSGVSIIATIHGKDEKQLRNRENISKLLDFFECFIVLSKRFGAGTIEEVYCVD